MSEQTATYCAYHPQTETGLRCNQCEKYICPKCATRTPTGYRCKDCVRGQQKKFETANAADYLVGFVTAAVLSGVASFIISLIGMIGFYGWFIIIGAAPTAGIFISNILQNVTGRRRAKNLFYVIGAGMVAGAVPMILFNLIALDWFGLLFQGIYLVLVTPTVYYRTSGIQLFK